MGQEATAEVQAALGEEGAAAALPGTGKGSAPKKQEAAVAQASKTTYMLFVFIDDGTTEGDPVLAWLPIGEYAASSGGSALGHHFEREATPDPDRRFHAVPVRSTRAFLPPDPNPRPAFREAQ